MAIAFDAREPFVYVLQCDRDLPFEEQTRWILRVLPFGDDVALQNRISKQANGDGIEVGALRADLLKRGLIGVENFRDAMGDLVPFEADKGRSYAGVCGPSDAFLDRLSSDWRTELANAIQHGNRVTAAEKKIS